MAAHAGAAATSTAIRSSINVVRAAHGLPPLRASGQLAVAAGGHSREMGRLGYFSHSSADGTSFWKRIRHWYRSQGYSRWSVGENLLWSAGSLSAAQAVSMWMHSPPHRRNLLNGSWRRVGISVFHVGHAPGVFGGLDVTIVSADFGTRS